MVQIQLLSLKPKVDKGDVRVGFFTDDPQAMFHLKNDTATASVLMQALNSGYPVLSLNTSNQNKTGLLKMNLPVDSNEIGNINDSIIVADRSINFTTNGNIEPGLYVNDSSVSIGQDENENSLYVQSTAVVGEPFAGQLQLNSTTGLSIAGKLSVGHSMSSLTGGTVFAKDNLLVGQQSHELMPANLKGIYVERRLGVGIPKPQDAIAIQGGLKLKDKLDFYTDQSKIFSVKPREISVIPSNYGIDLNISKKMSFDVDNAPILSVVPEGVIIGDAVDIRGGDNSTTNNLIVSNNSGTANVLLDGKNGPPSVEFSTNAGAMVSTIGLRNVDSKTQLSIESNGSDLSAPDVVIISGKVGLGKTPGSHTNNNETKQHHLDVNGVVKSENLYINKDRMYPVPLGAIVMWTGSEADIPSGWQLCNGDLIQGTTDQYTPNLTDMFIKGASNLTPEKLNQTGGSHKIELSDDGAHTHVSDGIHAHVLSDDKHAHTLEVDSNDYNDNTAVVSNGVTHKDYDIRGPDGTETYAIKSNGHTHGLSASHSHGQDSQSKPGVHHLQAVSDTGAHTHKGGGHNHEWDNQPSFYVFAFIIKVSDQQF